MKNLRQTDEFNVFLTELSMLLDKHGMCIDSLGDRELSTIGFSKSDNSYMVSTDSMYVSSDLLEANRNKLLKELRG